MKQHDRVRKRAPLSYAVFYFLHFQILGKLIQLLFSLGLGQTVASLELARELIAFARDCDKVIIRQFTPFLLDFPRELLPVALDLFPVHDVLLQKLGQKSAATHGLSGEIATGVPALRGQPVARPRAADALKSTLDFFK
jgi:hypothetical protein